MTDLGDLVGLSDLDEDACDGCDHVQRLITTLFSVELHHLIPDDGAGHRRDAYCGCGPRIEWIEHDLVIVEHIDQDLDLALSAEE